MPLYGECLFKHLDHVGGLKLKRKSSCNYMKIKTTLKRKSLIHLRSAWVKALVNIFLWPVSAIFLNKVVYMVLSRRDHCMFFYVFMALLGHMGGLKLK